MTKSNDHQCPRISMWEHTLLSKLNRSNTILDEGCGVVNATPTIRPLFLLILIPADPAMLHRLDRIQSRRGVFIEQSP